MFAERQFFAYSIPDALRDYFRHSDVMFRFQRQCRCRRRPVRWRAVSYCVRRTSMIVRTRRALTPRLNVARQQRFLKLLNTLGFLILTNLRAIDAQLATILESEQAGQCHVMSRKPVG